MATSDEFAYRPDVIIDVDLPPPGILSARQPQVIVEVAAAGSERAAFIEQWRIYRALPTLSLYVSVESTREAVVVYRRAGEDWKTEVFEEADDQFILPAIHGTVVAGNDLRRGLSPRRRRQRVKLLRRR